MEEVNFGKPIRYTIATRTDPGLLAIKLQPATAPTLVWINQGLQLTNNDKQMFASQLQLGDEITIAQVKAHPNNNWHEGVLSLTEAEIFNPECSQAMATQVEFIQSFAKHKRMTAYAKNAKAGFFRVDCPVSMEEKRIPQSVAQWPPNTPRPKSQEVIWASLIYWPKGVITNNDCSIVLAPSFNSNIPYGLRRSNKVISRITRLEPMETPLSTIEKLFGNGGLNYPDEVPKLSKALLMATNRADQAELENARHFTTTVPLTITKESPNATFHFEYTRMGASLPDTKIAASLKKGTRLNAAPVLTKEEMEDGDTTVSSSIIVKNYEEPNKFKFNVKAQAPLQVIFDNYPMPIEELNERQWTISKPISSYLEPRSKMELRNESLTHVLTEVTTQIHHITKKLLGVQDGPTLQLEPTSNHTHHTFTPHQMLALSEIINTTHPLLAIQSPAGSGKTTLAAHAIINLIRKHNTKIIATSTMNIAIDTLASKIMEIRKDEKMLVIQSLTQSYKSSSKDLYHQFRLPNLLQKLAKGEFSNQGGIEEAERMQAYKAALAVQRRYDSLEMENPVRDDQSTETSENDEALINRGLDLLIKHYQPDVVIGTLAMVLNKAQALKSMAEFILIDEAGTAPLAQVITFPLVWTNIKNMCLIGDDKQLPCSTNNLPHEVRGLLGISALKSSLENQTVPRVFLKDVWRSHPTIAKAASLFAYNNQLQTRVKPSDRSKITKIEMYKDSPINIIHTNGRSYANAAKSLANPEQEKIALSIIQHLNAEGVTDIRAICFYSNAAQNLQEMVNKAKLKAQIGTVDACQGQQHEVTILLTTYAPEDPTSKPSAHLNDRERINVAVTRAQHGLFIIANVLALEKSTIWKEYFTICRELKANFWPKKEETNTEVEMDEPDSPEELPVRIALNNLSTKEHKLLYPSDEEMDD